MEEVNLLPGPSQNNGNESSNFISLSILNNSNFSESTSSFRQSNFGILCLTRPRSLEKR